MKIHIFALRWGDEIRRSSQLRTLLKLVVVNRTWKKFRPVRDLNPWPLRFHISKIFIHLDVYLDPIHWPAPSWLVSSIGRALHRYRRGHGFKSRTGLKFFQVLLTTTSFSSVLSCEDLLISTWLYFTSSSPDTKYFPIQPSHSSIMPISQIHKLKVSHLFIKLLILQVWLFQITWNSSGKRNGLSITFNSYNSSFMGRI